METEQSLNQEWHPTNQQGDDGPVNGLTYIRATGGQAGEVSRPIPNTEEIAGHLLNARERQSDYQHSDVGGSSGVNQSMLNGGGVISREESSIQEPVTCQLVNGQQQQPSYQQIVQANALPTQEMGLDRSQRRDRQEVPYPIQETGPFEVEHEELPPCNQQLSGVDVNGVSSTGEKEQAVEHNCSPQELQLWKQELDRQANVTHTCTTFVWGKNTCYINNSIHLARKYARIFVRGHFLFRVAKKTVSYEEQIMAKDKYPSIFSPQMEAIVFTILQIFFATRTVLKIGEYLTIIPRARVGYEKIDNQRGA